MTAPAETRTGLRLLIAGFLIVLSVSALFRLGPVSGHQKPDETYVSQNLLNFYRTGSLAPANYIHPPLYHYICLAALSARSHGRAAAEWYEEMFFTDRNYIYRTCRLVSWVFSAALPPLLFMLVWYVSGSFPAALLSGLLAALSRVQAAPAREALPESLLSLLFIAGAGLCLAGVRKKKAWLVLLASFAGGLAAAAKTNGALLLPLLLWASWRLADGKADPGRCRRASVAASVFMTASASWAAFCVSGAWKSVIAAFSPDGIVEADTMLFFGAGILKTALVASVAAAGAGFFLFKLLRHRGEPGRPEYWVERFSNWIGGGLPYAVCASFAAGFLIFNPYWVLEAGKYASTLVLASIHVQYAGHFGMFGQDWAWYFSSMFRQDGALFLLTLAGLAAGVRLPGTSRQAGIFFMLLFLYIGAWEEKADRFVLFLLPLAYLSAGIGAAHYAARYRAAKRLMYLALACVAALQGWQTMKTVGRERLPDSRLAAMEWMKREIPDKAKLLADGYFLPGLYSRADEERPRRYGSYSVFSPPDDLAHIRAPSDWSRYDYLVLNSESYWYAFDPAQEPAAGHALREAYEKKKDFYAPILEGRVGGLALIAEFGGSDYSGPEIRIYRIGKTNARGGRVVR